MSNVSPVLHTGFYEVLTSRSAALNAVDHIYISALLYAYHRSARQIGPHH